MPAEYSIDYRLSDRDANIHSAWDNSLDPILTVESGDVVRFECRDAGNGQIDVDSTAAEILDMNRDPIHPLQRAIN
ncbi:MAG: acetamidase/formamidase family protein [Halobacteriales archaeon]